MQTLITRGLCALIFSAITLLVVANPVRANTQVLLAEATIRTAIAGSSGTLQRSYGTTTEVSTTAEVIAHITKPSMTVTNQPFCAGDSTLTAAQPLALLVSPLCQVLAQPEVLGVATESAVLDDDTEEVVDVQVTDTAKVQPTTKPVPTPAAPAPQVAIDSQALTVVVPNPTPEPTPTAVTVEPSDKTPLYHKYGAEYGVDPVIMQKIASCESGERANATNGPYGGMFQFVSSTWVSNRKAMGENPDPALRFNAEEAVKTAAFKMSRDGYGAWPSCSRKALNQLAQAS